MEIVMRVILLVSFVSFLLLTTSALANSYCKKEFNQCVRKVQAKTDTEMPSWMSCAKPCEREYRSEEIKTDFVVASYKTCLQMCYSKTGAFTVDQAVTYIEGVCKTKYALCSGN